MKFQPLKVPGGVLGEYSSRKVPRYPKVQVQVDPLTPDTTRPRLIGRVPQIVPLPTRPWTGS